jgi:hypothetical protein
MEKHQTIIKMLKISFLLAFITIFCIGCNGDGEGEVAQAENLSEAEQVSSEMQNGESVTEQIVQTEELTQEETTPEETLPELKKGYRYAWVCAYGTLNVRKKPSKNAKVIGTVSYADYVVVKGKKSKGYYQITGTDSTTKEEIKGYCAAKYLTFKQIKIEPVELDIPLYLQTDKKWAKVTLGSSGRTIEAIGCTTTCLAMAETYIRGKTVTPDSMAKELYYTSKGELGWPDSYTASYDESTYLQVVYDKLSQNIPVLIGSQKTNGRPHWVLITGYTGNGKKLKAKDFVIRDPLTKKRTNLAQYLKIYPRFMKVVYSNGQDSSKYKKESETTTNKTTARKNIVRSRKAS